MRSGQPRDRTRDRTRAHEVAQEIVSCDPIVVREIKRLVDAGAATTLVEGLDLEDAASRQNMAGLSAEDIAARRVEVQRRGGKQSRG